MEKLPVALKSGMRLIDNEGAEYLVFQMDNGNFIGANFDGESWTGELQPRNFVQKGSWHIAAVFEAPARYRMAIAGERGKQVWACSIAEALEELEKALRAFEAAENRLERAKAAVEKNF